MKIRKGTMLLAIIAMLIATAGGIIIVVSNLSSSGSMSAMSEEMATKSLSKMVNKLNVVNMDLEYFEDIGGGMSTGEMLPNISQYEELVRASSEISIEIMSSTEKATVSNGKPDDRWLVDVANEFNKSRANIGGTLVSVSLRGVESGTAMDYISSGKHVPDVFTPANHLWADSLVEQGIDLEEVTDRLIGNVAGYAIEKNKYKQLQSSYGEINTKTIDTAVANGEISIVYSNPFISSTAANKLLSTLYSVDSSNPTSEAAASMFEKFQSKVKAVTYTTLQMEQILTNGNGVDVFVTESQQFYNSGRASQFEFVPFGVRHDSPVYIARELSEEQRQLVDMFVQFAKSPEMQELGKKYGFNRHDDYTSTENIDGYILKDAQKLFKDKKNGDRRVIAVFVVDTSGSMAGDPINSARHALRNGAQFIGDNCDIGLVTFSDRVQIDLPLGEFTDMNRGYFLGAINRMDAIGGTHIYDALAVAENMIVEYKKTHPNDRPIIFLMSDGMRSGGLNMGDIEGITKNLRIPINTISYNGDYSYLRELSDINEAAYIIADDGNVAYRLASFFNSEL